MNKLLRRLLSLGCLAATSLGVAATPSCQPSFPTEIQGRELSLTLATGAAVGSPSARLPITFTTPTVFSVNVAALDQNGNVDPTFNGYVRFSVEPGAVTTVTSPVAVGRNVLLKNGVASDVGVSIVGAYGDARIWVEDLGYQPVDPAGVPLDGGGVRLPQCANGVDDNHNGLIDYPADPGCYAADDDSEDGGSYAGASTSVIYFAYPRIADVQGVNNLGAGTPFPNEQVQINTMWNGTSANTRYGVVVNGVSSSGFFLTDISPPAPGDPPGYNSVYAYNYTAPPLMNVCDRLMAFGGTAAEFYGFVEINYPTWSLEQWDPTVRPCLVPEPALLTIAQINGTSAQTKYLAPLEAGLVRVPADDGSTIHVASLLGPGLIPYTITDAGPVTIGTITADATSCDYEGTGKIDFENAAEAACEAACTANVECSEYTQYASESQFQIVVSNATGTQAVQITGDGAASPSFNPVQMRGQPLKAFTGVLTYFSGGSQFTIQARCADDIVAPGGTVLPSSPPWPTPIGQPQAPAACVVNRALPGQASN